MRRLSRELTVEAWEAADEAADRDRARALDRMRAYEAFIAEQRARKRRDSPKWPDLTTRWGCPIDVCHREALQHSPPTCPAHHVPMTFISRGIYAPIHEGTEL